MAGANELVIKITGDIDDFTSAMDAASDKTKGLSDSLETTAKVAGLAFAALTAEIGLSVAAYAESEKATNQLTSALQRQGIYSKETVESYQKMATELQNLTGVSDEAVMGAQTTLQAYLGQTKVTKELTMATADFAAAQGIDIQSAASIFGKAINGNVGALKRYGIELDENASKNEILASLIQKTSDKFGGQAVAAAAGFSGSLAKLKENFSGLQEEIGARFAPILQKAADGLTKIIQAVANNKPLLDFTVSMLAAGVAVTGAVTVAAAAGLGFLKLKAALEAAKIATSAMSIATRGLVAATGLGLLIILVTEIALNWNAIWPRMQAVFQAFTQNITNLATGLGKVLQGVFTFDKAKIEEGLNQVKTAFSAGLTDYEKIATEKLAAVDAKEEEAEKKKTDRNDKSAAERERKAAAEKEAKMETALDLEALDQQIYEQDSVQKAQQYEETLAQNAEFQALTEEQKQQFRQQNDAKNVESQTTESTAQRNAAQLKLQEQQKTNATFLAEQQKYGTSYATINKVMHSDVYQGTKQATGEMIQFTQSSNATLKGIGKAAAVADIVMKTAQSAMNIYAGFSTIPIIGPILGVAGAAAAVAFGVEQVGKVTGAAQGGLLTGGISGVDSIPVLAQRGELISPTSSFEEVIGSVRAMREAEKIMGDGGSIGAGGGGTSVMIGFDGKEASQVLTARQIADESLGTSPRGASEA